MDASRVTARLFTGSLIRTPSDVQDLINLGVTAIIDCVAGWDDKGLLAGQPIAYLYNGTEDDGTSKSPAWFKASADFWLPQIATPGKKCFCHCAAGAQRGPSMTYFLLRCDGLAGTTAEALIRNARPQVGLRYMPDADKAITALGYD